MELDFLSDAWVNALKERVNSSDAYKKATKDWRTKMTFALLPDAEKGIEPCAVVLDLADGGCQAATRVTGPGPYEGDYVIRGVAPKWKELLTKVIFPVPALMSGQLQLVKGSNTALMMKMGAAQALLDEAGAVPTKYPV